MYIHTLARFCESQRCFSLFSPLNILHTLFSPPFLPVVCSVAAVCLLLCPVPFCLLCPVTAVPFALSPLSPSGTPVKLPGLLCVLSCVVLPAFSACRLPLAAAVTRPPSGAKRCDSGGRCTAYMSPALSPLVHVLPWLVPLLVPCVCPCLVLLPAAVCRLVAVIVYTPLCPGRRRCGAASGV